MDESPLKFTASEASESAIELMRGTISEAEERRSVAEAAASSSAPTAASQYWAGNLDPQNLERKDGSKPAIPLRDEIIFASTPDVEAARDWLLKSRRAPGCIVDLGAGLGAISFMFARRGSWVLCVDTSLGRLRELRARAAEAKCSGLITPIVADAAALPFADRSLPAVFTKSVLIHTDVPKAAAEVARILSPGGRAAFVEPQGGNPFAWLYRRTLAPKAWKSITRYFDGAAQRTCIGAIGRGIVKPFYLFSFFAFAFQFAWPNLDRFSRTLARLHRFDQWLFTSMPWTRSLAWFGLIEVEKPSNDETFSSPIRRGE